ncbi:MAG TPA: site-specific DNA-methyltransferase [Nitrososphaerales archaeon]|nr:site-specific DNA-methyltransferase [Nitrososphaerales archaeon]
MKTTIGQRFDYIKCADSHHLMDFVTENSIDLTVTSPPYGNAIDYGTHSRGIENERYRGKKLWKDPESYITDIAHVFEQVRRATKIGGYCAIVIGYEVVSAELIPLPSMLLTEILRQQKIVKAEEQWVLREEIIWNKVTAGRNGSGNRFGVTVMNPYPTYYHANVMHEYIFVLSKGSPKIKRDEARERLQKLVMDDEMKRDIANSTWHIVPEEEWTFTPVPPGSVDHPAPFPEQMAWRLISLFSNPNDIVLDPFNGSGTTTKVANHLHRHYIGVDIIKEYCKIAEDRLKEPLNLSTKIWVQKWGSKPLEHNFETKPIDEFK